MSAYLKGKNRFLVQKMSLNIVFDQFELEETRWGNFKFLTKIIDLPWWQKMAILQPSKINVFVV